MKRQTLTLGLTFLISFVFGQNQPTITQQSQLVTDSTIKFAHFPDLQVYQYFDNNSSKRAITHSEKYDDVGRIIAEYFKDYKTDKGNGRTDVLTINEYNELGKLKVSTDYYETFMAGEVQKTFYYYDDSLLTTVESFDFKKRLKANVDKGYGRPGGCIITSEDYEKERTWKLTRLVRYEYNIKGQKTKSYSIVSQGSHNGFEYEYNAEGKLVKEKSFDKDELLWTTEYKYSGLQEISELTWNKNNWGTTKKIKTYNDHHQLLEEVTIQNENKYVDKYIYDEKARLVKFESYDSHGKLGLTHIYRYK